MLFPGQPLELSYSPEKRLLAPARGFPSRPLIPPLSFLPVCHQALSGGVTEGTFYDRRMSY